MATQHTEAQAIPQPGVDREQLAAALQDCRWLLRQLRENFVRGRGLRTGDTKTFLRAEQSVETAWAGLGLGPTEQV
jgi:hypothetical protein